MRAPEAGEKILWVRFGAFGDVLEAAAEVCNFKGRFPDASLTFLTHPEYEELLRSQPYVDDVIAGHKKPLAKWRQTVQKIRAGDYQWLVNTHRGGRASLLSLFSRVKHRIGTASMFFLDGYQGSLDDWSRLCGVDLRDRSRAMIFPSAKDRETALNLLTYLTEPLLFAVIGASNPIKMWTAEGWIEFLGGLVKKGWRVVLNGHGPREAEIGREIENSLASENVLNLVGLLDFAKMAGVVSHCAMAIGNDTGPLHLAALCGVPTMGLFNQPGKDSALDLFSFPWFRGLQAGDYVDEKAFPLKKLPAAAVTEAFDAFAAEWRF